MARGLKKVTGPGGDAHERMEQWADESVVEGGVDD